jgi:hypothetical protein
MFMACSWHNIKNRNLSRSDLQRIKNMRAIADSNPATNKAKRFRSTLYELMEALGDVIQPGEEPLIAVVVQDLMKSGQLQFLGR